MVLLETEEGTRIGYMECQDIDVIMVEDQQIRGWEQRYGVLRSQALGTVESAHFIRRVAGEL